MEISELLSWITENLDDAEKATVTKAIQRDSVKNRVAGLKAQSEFDKIYNQQVALQQELDGDQAAGKVGARATRDWYEKNSAAVLANDKAIRDFEAKYGQGSFAKAAAGELPAVTPPVVTPPATGTLTEAQVNAMLDARLKAMNPGINKDEYQRLIDERFQSQYAPNTANTVITAGHLLQKHFLAGRKDPIDFNNLAKIATDKYQGDMNKAYDEWDTPVREKIAAEKTEAEINRRVDEAIQKRGAVIEFPAGADAGPSSLERRADADKFDRSALLREMTADVRKIGQVQ